MRVCFPFLWENLLFDLCAAASPGTAVSAVFCCQSRSTFYIHSCTQAQLETPGQALLTLADTWHLCHLCGSLWRTAELSPVGSLMDSTCLCHGIHFASATNSPLKPLSALLPSDLDSLWKSIKANLFYPSHFTVYVYLHWPSFGVIPKLMSTPHLARAVTHFHFTLVTVEGSVGVRQSKVWEPFSSLNAKEGTLH